MLVLNKEKLTDNIIFRYLHYDGEKYYCIDDYEHIIMDGTKIIINKERLYESSDKFDVIDVIKSVIVSRRGHSRTRKGYKNGDVFIGYNNLKEVIEKIKLYQNG